MPLQSYSPTPKPTKKPAKQPTTYTVQRGEYLTQIAADLNLDWKELAQLNGLPSPYTIHPGQILKLPGSNLNDPTPAPTQDTNKPSGNTYTVKKGDHLMQIARNLQLNWKAIAQLNSLTYPYALYPGNVLKLPGPEAGPPPPPLSGDNQSTPDPEPTPSYSGKKYTVQKGDYLYELARRLGINWQTLASLNGISYPYIIYPGQVLKLP